MINGDANFLVRKSDRGRMSKKPPENCLRLANVMFACSLHAKRSAVGVRVCMTSWMAAWHVTTRPGRVHLGRWQVTLCDPIWQMTFRSFAMGLT